MPLVLHWLDRLQSAAREQVGDKAFQLGQLQQLAYPVLPGFAIAATALPDFLAAQALERPDLAALPSDRPHQLQAIARELRRAILTADLPEAWLPSLVEACQQLPGDSLILRPSLALTQGQPPAHLLEPQWCGQQPAAIAQSLKQLWAELFRARNLVYWQRQNLSWEQIHCAVLVQPAIAARATGTIHCVRVASPQEHRLDWCIQAVLGLGVSWTRGEVMPDTYWVEAGSGRLKHSQLGRKSRAYYLRCPPAPNGQDCLERVQLDEQAQQQWALDPEVLPLLLALAERVHTEFAASDSLEWLLSGSAPEFYLGQLSRRPPPTASFSPAQLPGASRLFGVGAAPGWAIAPVCRLAGPSKHWQAVPPRHILVIDRITPDWLPLLEQAAGLVIEQGGTTSHGAIVARELGIPAVVGVYQATQRLHAGDRVAIDGTRGEVHLLALDDPSLPVNPNSEVEIPLAAELGAPLTTRLWVNLSQPSAIAQAAALPVQGVGLLRAELMMLSLLRESDLTWWLQRPAALSDRLAQLLDRFARAFAPRPVFYRSTDWRAPEFPLLPGTHAALNPLLGTRGTRSYQVRPELFVAELAALAQVQQACGNLNLILPFVRSVEEFAEARDRVRQVGLLADARFQLWLAAEVPSALFLLPDYVEAGAQGVAIGSNDLAQLLLGADRDDPDLSQALNDGHPVVWQALEQLIRSARGAGVPCSICGQAPVKWPALIERLVEWGIAAISVEPGAVLSAYRAIAAAEQRGPPPRGSLEATGKAPYRLAVTL